MVSDSVWKGSYLVIAADCCWLTEIGEKGYGIDWSQSQTRNHPQRGSPPVPCYWKRWIRPGVRLKPTGNDKIESREEGYLIPTWVCKITLPTLCHQGYEQTEKPLKDRGWYLASSPGYSQILSRSCGEKLILRDEIWEWPGEEARWY